jgi:hypothetical protein
MKKWTNELKITFSKEKVLEKTHEEVLKVPGYKENANQNHVNILLHSC